MKRWEYHAHTVQVAKVPTLLNSLGLDGWELVSSHPHGAVPGTLLVILKREVTAMRRQEQPSGASGDAEE